MSRENAELVRASLQRFIASGDIDRERYDADFVWDMSTFAGWPEKRHYHGAVGVDEFLSGWLEAWEDWRLELEAVHPAGESQVVAVLRQYGRSKSTGLDVAMHFAQVWTLRNGLYLRMEMYASPAEALAATGLTK